MVDSRARRVASQLLRDFFDGKITNDEYNDQFPDSSADSGLQVVYRRIWISYSDLHSHYLDRGALSQEDHALFGRCIAFLRTDLEYEGEPIGIRLPLSQIFGGFLGRNDQPLTILGTKSMEASGFFSDFWPFISEAQHTEVLQNLDSSSQ